MTSQDPTEVSHWQPLRQLQEAMEGEIARLYQERGIEGVSPRFSMVLIRLSYAGPLTIRDLADGFDRTHSAMSQTVSALRREGLVETRPGSDARTRLVDLTEQGRELVPFLAAEWRATEDAVAELESEVPYPLTRVVQDLTEALSRRSFKDRIIAHLEEH